MLALLTDHLADLLLHQLGQHAEPDADAQREQPLLRRVHQLAERLLHPRRQRQLTSLTRGNLLQRYRLHGGSFLPSIDDFALATVTTRPDKAGGPPPQLLRATGQPRAMFRFGAEGPVAEASAQIPLTGERAPASVGPSRRSGSRFSQCARRRIGGSGDVKPSEKTARRLSSSPDYLRFETPENARQPRRNRAARRRAVLMSEPSPAGLRFAGLDLFRGATRVTSSLARSWSTFTIQVRRGSS